MFYAARVQATVPNSVVKVDAQRSDIGNTTAINVGIMSTSGRTTIMLTTSRFQLIIYTWIIVAILNPKNG